MAKSVILRGKVFIKEATLASGSGDDLLTIDATTGEVGKISGTPLTTTLTAGNLFVGNASNVATAVAMSGDVTIDSSGVTAIGTGVIVNADINASAAIAVSKLAALTASRAVVSDASGFLSVSATTDTQIGYLSTTTSDVQTQINAKQATITGAATTIVSSDLTANRALISGSLGKVEVSSVTNTELGHLSGVTSAIQTQFSGKLSATVTGAAEGDIIYYNGTNWVNLARGTSGYTLQSTGTSIQWASATANGIPAGGTDNQALIKTGSTDYVSAWETLTVAHIPEITASAAEINLLDGVTATTTEINYLDGVTSNIQSQFGNKLSTSLPHNAIFVGNISNIAASLAAGSEGQILSISSGAPTWTTISASGVTTIAALDGTTKSANAASISGVNLYLQTADATYPGVVSTVTQTFAGTKIFNGSVGVGLTPTHKVDVTQTATTNGYAAVNALNSGANIGTAYGVIGQATGASVTNVGGYFAATGATNNYGLLVPDGLVGIGTTTPSYPLEVSAATAVVRVTTTGTGDVNLNLRRTGGTASEWAAYIPTASTNLRLYNGGDRFTFTSGGQLGIGTTSPNAPLQFANTGAKRKIVLAEAANNDHQVIGFGAEGSDLQFRINETLGNHVFYAGTSTTTSSELMRITGTGNVGIGVSPSHKLDVYNSSDTVIARFKGRAGGVTDSDPYVIDVSGSRFWLYNQAASGNASLQLENSEATFITGSATTNASINVLVLEGQTTGIPANGLGTGIAFEAESAGGVKRGATLEAIMTDVTSASEDFDFVMKLMSGGTAVAEKFRFASTGTGTATDWVATSDRRLKSNIERVEDDVIEEIKKVGSLFSRYEKSGKTERGFIAQELLEVSPEYVTVPEDPEQMMAVNYSKMVALLFKGFEQLLNK